MPFRILPIAVALAVPGPAQDRVDEAKAVPGEWGFRPADGATVERTPPPFSWRPQQGARTYELEASRDPAFDRVDYAATDIDWNVHCPPTPFEPGSWTWRFRFVDEEGVRSAWSSVRRFDVPDGAPAFPLPSRDELLSRIPDEHPRLFLRPEDVGGLRRSAAGECADGFAALTARCDALLESPPPTTEPPKYAADTVRGSDPWRAVWWGNRKATILALEGAANLAFAWRIGGDERYAELARRILMDCAAWDPRGATGYRYNDEAGMPYAYHFSRTYTLLNPRLTEEERATCREVMRVRGREMFAHLAPRHFWRPYSSHSNRAWHFLGEVGIAFHGELPEADDWIWFAANVFATVYPVWSDADGGWHEGTAYWNSYLQRFTWWVDVQRAALGLDAYELPFFSRAGNWAMYTMPPGTRGGGFGDLNARRTARDNRRLMTVLATQSANPYWRWYVEQLGGLDHGSDWIGFLRSSVPDVEARAPDDLPTSMVFRGTGIAVLQSRLSRAEDNVEVLFKSSPFGTQSHGYEAQNSFLLYAFGERLLIRSGRRDSYGSKHHKEWMWSTRSTNSVTIGGRDQRRHSASARGRITGFHTRPGLHWVEGEAGEAYDGAIGFRRGILFVEPDLIVIRDRLSSPEPARFAWWLHAPTPFGVESEPGRYTVRSGAAACVVGVHAPAGTTWAQTDAFDPPPRERIQLVESHLTGTTEPAREVEFVTIVRPFRASEAAPVPATLERRGDGTYVTARLRTEEVSVVLRADGPVDVRLSDADGRPTATFESSTATLETGAR